jgi:hypothetical protein
MCLYVRHIYLLNICVLILQAKAAESTKLAQATVLYIGAYNRSLRPLYIIGA